MIGIYANKELCDAMTAEIDYYNTLVAVYGEKGAAARYNDEYHADENLRSKLAALNAAMDALAQGEEESK